MVMKVRGPCIFRKHRRTLGGGLGWRFGRKDLFFLTTKRVRVGIDSGGGGVVDEIGSKFGASGREGFCLWGGGGGAEGGEAYLAEGSEDDDVAVLVDELHGGVVEGGVHEVDVCLVD